MYWDSKTARFRLDNGRYVSDKKAYRHKRNIKGRYPKPESLARLRHILGMKWAQLPKKHRKKVRAGPKISKGCPCCNLRKDKRGIEKVKEYLERLGLIYELSELEDTY